MTTEGQIVLTVAELDQQEQELIARRDSYVNQANAQINLFNGAIMQVQSQKTLLLERQNNQAVKEPENEGGE